MVLSLTRAPVVPEVAITIIIGLIPILLGVAVVLVIYRNRQKVDISKRVYLITIGILALFLWAGFLVGPGLLVLASIMPSRKGETHVQDITKEMQTLEALLESEKRYRSVIEDQTELICRCLPDGKLILVNEAYCRYFGKKREELIGSSFMPFILFEDRERVERHFASLTPEKPVATQEQRVIAAGGEIRWQQWTNRAMFDDQGRLIEYQSVGRDITDRKKAEEALHESEERYRQLVELDPDSIIVHREGRLVFVNPATVRLMGASSPEDLIGKPVLDFVAPENREIIIKRMQHILETHEPVNLIEEKLIRMDGSLIDVEITGTFITFEGKPAVQTVVHNITERKLAEEALRESEERFRLAFENAYIGMYLVDLDGRLLKVNNQMCEIFGYNQEELESMTVNDITHPEDLDTSPSFIQQALSGEIASGTFEKRYIHKQGNIVHGLVSSSLVRDSEGTPLYFISQVQDITERKQVEENLKFRNIVLSTQQETSLDGILIVDEQGKIISFNQRFVDMWDIPPEVIAPHSEKSALQSVLDKIDDPESFLSRIEYLNTHRGEKSLDEIALKDGRILDRYSAPMLGPDEKYYGRVWYFRDITDRRQAESKLRTALQQFSDIIELLPDATFVIDSEKKVIAWNRAIEEMTGVKKKEIIGKGDYAYAIPFYKERRPILIDLVFANDSEIEQKYDFVGKKENSLYAEAYVPFTYGGKGAYLSGVAAPLFDGSGKRVGAIESIRDITERKLAEDSIHKYAEELERSNEFKDLFTDILSHDLLNPAGIIKGYTDVLLDMEKDEQKLHALQAINRNNERLIDLIERASTFAKLESMEEIEFKEMDIGPIFKEVVDNFRLPLKEKQMIIEFVADGTYPASVNPVIEEVFTNLLSNAIKYSPEESKIIIDITDSGDDWKVSVTDFGVGISNEDKPRIFERFRRVGKGTTKGTGLGLAIVKRIIDLHGGSVGIEDNPAGQGCMFWITVRKA
jgi:two-component system sensor histidine kinase/response regulator